MKRSCDEMDVTENDSNMVTDETESRIKIPKKLRENEKELGKALQIMEFQVEPSGSQENTLFFNALRGYGQHTLVERESNPGGYALLNADYVGKKTHQEMTELQANFDNAANFTQANAVNKMEMIGQQMKHLQESLYKVIQDTKRDGELHTAACNFLKKPGHTYHLYERPTGQKYLYERPTGQKYFSMLSPQDWNGNSPHKFLGSWFLDSDQSWVPAEDIHLRHQGLNFLREFYMDRKSIQ